VAVIGYGSIGRRHLANLERLGVGQRWVVRRPEGSNPAFAPPPGVELVHSDQEVIAAGLDLAIICNPTALHVVTAEKYVAAGIPILVEKPLCAPGQEEAAARLVTLAHQRGAAAGIAYCLRYHPAYRLAHDIVTSGGLGPLLSAKAWFESYLPDWHPWEDYRQSYAARADLGGGVLPTLDHEIDFMNWCLGDPIEVAGEMRNSGTLGIDVPDTASVFLSYAGEITNQSSPHAPREEIISRSEMSTLTARMDESLRDSGCRLGETLPPVVPVHISLSFCQHKRRRGFEFVGQNGGLQFDWNEGSLQRIGGGRSSQTLWRQTPYDVNDMYKAMLDDFLNALQQGSDAPVPIEKGAQLISPLPWAGFVLW
jgi:predicted dehydrogenase